MGTQRTGVGFSPQVVEEEIPMTMQVGMVGTDGVLIASDTQRTEEMGLRQSYNSSKIRTDEECGVLVSLSGKLVAAGYLADGIITKTKANPTWLESEMGAVQEVEKSVLPRVPQGGEPCSCLVVFTRPEIALYRFQIVQVGISWQLVTDQQSGKVYAGDCKNSAIFWAQHYYPRHPKLPIRKLIPLAAHLIYMAHRLNTTGISGLEIALCDATGVHRVSDSEIKALETQSEQRDREIGQALLGDIA